MTSNDEGVTVSAQLLAKQQTVSNPITGVAKISIQNGSENINIRSGAQQRRLGFLSDQANIQQSSKQDQAQSNNPQLQLLNSIQTLKPVNSSKNVTGAQDKCMATRRAAVYVSGLKMARDQRNRKEAKENVRNQARELENAQDQSNKQNDHSGMYSIARSTLSNEAAESLFSVAPHRSGRQRPSKLAKKYRGAPAFARARGRNAGQNQDNDEQQVPFYDQHNGKISQLFKDNIHESDWLSKRILVNTLATQIQALWRGHQARKKFKQLQQQRAREQKREADGTNRSANKSGHKQALDWNINKHSNQNGNQQAQIAKEYGKQMKLKEKEKQNDAKIFQGSHAQGASGPKPKPKTKEQNVDSLSSDGCQSLSDNEYDRHSDWSDLDEQEIYHLKIRPYTPPWMQAERAMLIGILAKLKLNQTDTQLDVIHNPSAIQKRLKDVKVRRQLQKLKQNRKRNNADGGEVPALPKQLIMYILKDHKDIKKLMQSQLSELLSQNDSNESELLPSRNNSPAIVNEVQSSTDAK